MTAIPLWLHFLVYVVAIWAGHREARRLRKKAGGSLPLQEVLHHAPYLYGMLALVFLPMLYGYGLSKYPKMEWALPLWVGHSLGPSIWCSVLFAYVFFSALAVQVAFDSGHAERWKLPIAGLLLALIVESGHWLCTETALVDLRDPIIQGPVVIQTSPVSCAAASAASVLRAWGRETSEREMVQLLRTSRVLGTSDSQLVYGLATLGISCQRATWTLSQLQQQKPPLILFIRLSRRSPQEDHAAVFAGTEHDRILVWDPARGVTRYSHKDFLALWSGKALPCQHPSWAN